MGQTKIHSLIEASLNTTVGFAVGILTQVVVFPMYGMHISIQQDAQITTIFTVVGFLRSYLFRRLFNRITGKAGVEAV